MLTRLYIKNFVLIEELELDLEHGFYAITGETGSGKSIILDAINFCINGSASQDLIKAGKEHLQVVLTFDIDSEIKNLLEENGIEIEKNEISLSRTFSKTGKKKCLINNQPISQKIIDLFIEDLITIYAQHSLSSLFKQNFHIKFLDNYLENKTNIFKIKEIYKEIKQFEKELDKLSINNAQIIKEKEYIEHIVNDLKSLKIKENEEEELSIKRIELQNISKKSQLINEIISNIESSDIGANISSIIRMISRSKENEIFEPILEKMQESLDMFSIAEQELQNLTNIEYSENQLDTIEERLFSIRAIARKYQVPPSNLNNLLVESEQKLENISNFDLELSKIEKKIFALKKEFLEIASLLSEQRKKAASDLEKLVKSELDTLEMFSCNFKININSSLNENFKETGIDSVSFVASTNPGMPYSPIDKIASGGEMARFMLALQVSFLSKLQNLPVIIFDEIDTGIGGKVANSVGERLKKLSEFSQLLVVTHQPQVASKSSHHLLVKKYISDQQTSSSATLITKDEKILEIARMLSGKEITNASKLAANELINS